MNRFTVVWLEDAQNELAEVWLDSGRSEAVTTAAATIERHLRESPPAHGQHLAEGLWKIYRHPLKIYYSVSEADRLVEVSRVLLIPPDEQQP